MKTKLPLTLLLIITLRCFWHGTPADQHCATAIQDNIKRRFFQESSLII